MKVYTIWPDALYQRGKMHSLVLEEKRGTLRALGVGIVVGLAPARPDVGLQALHAAGELEYILHPIADGALRDAAPLLALAEQVAARASARQVAVLTHCNAGRNRSSLLSALLLRHWAGMDGPQAVAHLRRCRPRSLANEHFTSYLNSLGHAAKYAAPVAGQLELL